MLAITAIGLFITQNEYITTRIITTFFFVIPMTLAYIAVLRFNIFKNENNKVILAICTTIVTGIVMLIVGQIILLSCFKLVF
jgi:hypothetical protein